MIPFATFIQPGSGWEPANGQHYTSKKVFLITVIKREQIREGVFTQPYLHTRDLIGYTQAIARSDQAVQQVVKDSLDTIWDDHQVHQDVNQLSAAMDAFVNGTLIPQAQPKLDAERDARHQQWPTWLDEPALLMRQPPLDALPDLGTYVRHPWRGTRFENAHVIGRIQVGEYLEFVTSLLAPIAASEELFVQRTTNYRTAKTTLTAFDAVRGNLDQIIGDDGAILESHPRWQEAEAGLNYWIENIPRFRHRMGHLQQMLGPLPGGAAKVLKRRVTRPERDDVEANHALLQGPDSYERYKWFFKLQQGANPGVDWPWEINLTLKPGAEALLDAIARADGTFSAVITKENEHGCFGIHEDVLHAFYGLVNRVELKKNKPTASGNPFAYNT